MRVEGLLHLKDQLLSLEWTGTRTEEYVSSEGIGSDQEHLPVDWLELPVSWITEVRLRGGWWRPRLELRARRLDAFEGVPSAAAGRLALKIRRRDRVLARDMILAIELARADLALSEAEELAELPGDTAPSRREQLTELDGDTAPSIGDGT